MVNRIFLIYVGLIILLSVAYTGKNLELHTIYILSFRVDHLLHVALFLPWAFFGVKMDKNLPVFFFWGLLVAVASELVQYFLPYRSFNMSDMLANVIGLAMGFLLFIKLIKVKLLKEAE